MIELKNKQIAVTISELGAELQSIRRLTDNREYLWQGDPRYWARRSPILFPIVGTLWQNRCCCDGKEYELPRHGFAREMTFQTIAQNETTANLLLTDDASTLSRYPYHFHLCISYRLEGNTLHVAWQVYNRDNREIHFQIGGHPAFALAKPASGSLRFDRKTSLQRLVLAEKGCIGTDHSPLPTNEGVWSFDEESFRDDAIIIDNSQVGRIELLDAEGRADVAVAFRHPAVGIWSPYGKHAPFVCIEPWFGIADPAGFTGEFKEKPLMNHLQSGASWMAEYTITIG